MVLLWGILGGVFMLLVQICTAQNTGRTTLCFSIVLLMHMNKANLKFITRVSMYRGGAITS